MSTGEKASAPELARWLSDAGHPGRFARLSAKFREMAKRLDTAIEAKADLDGSVTAG